MPRHRFVAVGFAIAACLCAAPASAVVKVATFTGTLADGFDQTGVFNLAGGSLVGLGFTMSFRFDLSIGTRETAPEYDLLYGGDFNGTPTPVIHASITINGVTKPITHQYFGYILTRPEFVINQVVDNDFIGGEAVYNYLNSRGVARAIPSLLDQDYGPVKLVNLTAPVSSFVFTSFNASTGLYSVRASGSSNDDVIYTIRSVGGVPEPAAWAMLIAGFGMVGAAMRRRNSAVIA